jgi:hypothetical protein
MTLNGIIKKTTVGVASALALALLSVNKTAALGAQTGMEAAHTGDQSDLTTNQAVTQVTNIAMYAVGIVSIIIIVFSGIMYATAAGDEAKAKKARNGLAGGLVGLAIAILAWTLTNFVFTALTSTP